MSTVAAALPRRRRRGWRVALAAAGVLAAALAAGTAWLFPPLCFLNQTREVALPLCPTEATTSSERQVPEAGLTIHVYRPRGTASSTIVLVPGLHPLGVADPRYRTFAEACARAGFQVVAPDVVEFRSFRIDETVVDKLARLVDALPRHVPPESLRNVGLFGISYAGGPVMMAAARPEVAARIHFVGAFGGYYDLVHAVDYALTGRHPMEVPLPAPHQWARMIFVAQDAESFLPSAEAGLLRESLMLRLALKVEEAQRREARLSDHAHALLQAVLDGPPPHEVERFRRVLPRYTALSRQLSPAFVLARLDPRLRIYLLHGFGDDVIPYCETVEIERALREARHPHVRSLISGAFRHVDERVNAGEGRLQTLREQLRLLVWTRAFLGEAGG